MIDILYLRSVIDEFLIRVVSCACNPVNTKSRIQKDLQIEVAA